MNDSQLIDFASNSLIEVKDFSILYRQNGEMKTLINNISFNIMKGKYTALVGRSGIGKSLIIKAILGLLDGPGWELYGDVIYYDVIYHKEGNVCKESQKTSPRLKQYIEKYIIKGGKYNKSIVDELRKENLFTIFQGPDTHLHPSFTIGWQLKETVNPKDYGRKNVYDVYVKEGLTQVELESKYKTKYPHQISQGEKQRAMIAMALARSYYLYDCRNGGTRKTKDYGNGNFRIQGEEKQINEPQLAKINQIDNGPIPTNLDGNQLNSLNNINDKEAHSGSRDLCSADSTKKNYMDEKEPGLRNIYLTNHLLLADEPTSSLDPTTKKIIIEHLQNLREQNVVPTMFFITHDNETVSEILKDDDIIITLEEDSEKNTNAVAHYKKAYYEEIERIKEKKGNPMIFLSPLPYNKLREERKQKIESEHPILIIKKLKQSYKNKYDKKPVENSDHKNKGLRNVNLEVAEGEILGIVGKSGCGKTTLVKAIARLLPNTKGEIIYLDKNGKPNNLIKIQPNGLKEDSREMIKIRKNMQVIFQDAASIFNPTMTIGELIDETLDLVIEDIVEKYKLNREALKHKHEKYTEQFEKINQKWQRELSQEKKNKYVDHLKEIKQQVKLIEEEHKESIEDYRLNIIRECLAFFGICKDSSNFLDILSKYPKELSGGERQRLAMCRVFLLRPRLIIADEPFAEQDNLTEAEILGLIQKMNEDGTTFIIVTHNLEFAKKYCDRFVEMKDGEIKSTIKQAIKEKRVAYNAQVLGNVEDARG